MAAVKTKTPKLLAMVIILGVVAVGLTFTFPQEGAEFRNWAGNTIGNLFGSEENIELKREENLDDIKIADVDIEEKDDFDIDSTHKRKKEKLAERDRNFSDLAGEDSRDKQEGEEDSLAQNYLKKAEERLETYSFQRAAEFAEGVFSLKCSQHLKDKAREIKSKAEAMVVLTKDVKINETAYGEVKEVTLANGNKLKGKISSNYDGTMNFKGNDGISMKLKKTDILKIEEVKADDERAKLISSFEQKYSGAEKEGNPLSVYRAGMYGLENKLDEEGYNALMKAFDLAKGEEGGIIKIVHEDKGRSLLAQAVWYEDSGNGRMSKAKLQDCIKKYPDTQAAGKARKYLNYIVAEEKKPKLKPQPRVVKRKPEKVEKEKEDNNLIAENKKTLKEEKETEEETVEYESAPQSSYASFSKKDQKKLQEADDLYSKGVAHLKVAFANRPSHKSNLNFEKAEGYFRQAIDIWSPLFDKTKDNSLEIKMMKAQENLYSCLKLHTEH